MPTNCQLIPSSDFKQLKSHPFKELHTTTTANDPAFIFYTSGSSGHPKGVLHAQQVILGRKPSLENWLTLIPEDIVMQTDNFCWTYSMFTGLLDPLSVGATAIVLTFSNRSALAENLISPEQWIAIMQYYRVSVLVSTPNIYNSLVTSPCFKYFTNHTLRQAGSAGAFLVDKVQHLWMKQLKLPIFIALGMSEISTFISTGPKVPYHKDRLGKIQPGRKVTLLPIEEGFIPVPINTEGMLAIHKDELGFMIGYVGYERNESYKYRGDWFLTQDIVSMDVDGYIQYHGRADMIMKVDGGFRVSVLEIENQLKLHPTVLDVACTAIFNEKNAANQLIAYIVATQVHQKVAEELSRFLKQHLSDYKVPNYLYFVEHFPLNNRGKIIRTELAKLIPIYRYQIIN
ncbi:ANL family adenylate-forming protein [Legionella tunisiensis]|uniref:ANL family adenylate-forming protein n=1 Tax=Legionella tunisiensis TaxID=1034944 RepID=UPI0018DC61AD|nr:fatty acid--CoA ligase family protein [Legionella tunisiensis]